MIASGVMRNRRIIDVVDYRLLLIKLEGVIVLAGGWISQSGGLGITDPAWIERLGALVITAAAMWRLLWFELPGWRKELRDEREANAKTHQHHSQTIAQLTAAIRDSMDAEAQARGVAISSVMEKLSEILAEVRK